MRFDDLTFRVIDDFNLVPRYLFEQVPKRNYDIDNIYRWGPAFMANPFNILFGLYDSDEKMQGVLWCTIDPVVENLCVNIFSVNKKYQDLRGYAIKKTVKFLKQLIKQTGLKDIIIWTTTRPRAFERAGCKRFDRTLMEI